MATDQHFKVAISALGGQGGGVLAGWIVELGQLCGYLAQSTSVPGVAQRTGATVYYIELFPQQRADAAGKAPVLALMPVPGDVDIVLASEVMEAGRALERGIVTDRTTLIASTHRVYAIGEKIQMGDGRQDPTEVLDAARTAAKQVLLADMDACATASGSIISSVLFGALAGSGALPFERTQFEQVIRNLGRAVESNLAGFSAGFDAVSNGREASSSAEGLPATGEAAAPSFSAAQAAPAVRPLVERLLKEIPGPAQEMAYAGLKKVVDHSDPRYGRQYLDRLIRFVSLDGSDGYVLVNAVARYLALAMAFDDTIRVADLKTRASRFARFRKDVVAEPEQIVQVYEYMHPRVEEFCDLLPPVVARAVLRSTWARRALGLVLGKGRRIPTTTLRGYLPLYVLSSLKFWRRFTFKYQQENQRIERWLTRIAETAQGDEALAAEIAGLQRLIKGYGDTHARGLGNYHRLLDLLDQVKAQPDPAVALRTLKLAALEDEEGVSLKRAIDALTPVPQAA
ncbi:MAG: indolepyruvate oxidoreductase subunit beta family protein [Pseudomonadota bacterium]